MAVYVNLPGVSGEKHGLFESCLIKASDAGRIYDVIVRDGDGVNIPVDNGVAVCVGEFSGNGLEEVYASIAGVSDRIAVVGSPAIVKDASTRARGAAYNFFVPAGVPARAYELVRDDIFGCALYQFSEATQSVVRAGCFVVVDGNGLYVAHEAEPAGDAFGFIGRVHSVVPDSLGAATIVRICVIKNERL